MKKIEIGDNLTGLLALIILAITFLITIKL
jgi:hypothetical protein